MERFNNKPSLKEIFYALASGEPPDWSLGTVENADPEDLQEVKKVLEQGLPLSEAGIEIENLIERR